MENGKFHSMSHGIWNFHARTVARSVSATSSNEDDVAGTMHALLYVELTDLVDLALSPRRPRTWKFPFHFHGKKLRVEWNGNFHRGMHLKKTT